VPTTPTVDVVGLRALVRDANRLCDDAGPLNKALSAAGKQAAEPVAAQARSSYPQARSSYPQVSGRLAGSVRTSGTRSGAAVRVGSKALPYAGPVDFGGYPAGREYVAAGRYLFPAAEQLASTAAELYSAGAQKAFDGFNWTNETTAAEAVHD
jgi:hypothetical protein